MSEEEPRYGESDELDISKGARSLLSKWPFLMIPAQAMLDHNLKDGALRLLAYMCWRRDSEGKLWPSVGTMAQDLGLTATSVRKRLKELLDGEYVTVRYRDETSSVYTLTPKGFYRGGVQEPGGKQEASEQDQTDISDGVPSEASRPDPRTCQEWISLLREAKNKPGVMRHMFATLYADREPPDFGHIGRVGKNIGDWALFAKYVWDASSRPPAGSAINYVAGMHKGPPNRKSYSRTASRSVGTAEEFANAPRGAERGET